MKNILLSLLALCLFACGDKNDATVKAPVNEPVKAPVREPVEAPVVLMPEPTPVVEPSIPAEAPRVEWPNPLTEAQRKQLLDRAKALSKKTWEDLKAAVLGKKEEERVKAVIAMIDNAKVEAEKSSSVGAPQIVEALKSVVGEEMAKKYIEPMVQDEESIPVLATFLADLAHLNNQVDRLNDGQNSLKDLAEKAVIASSLKGDADKLQKSSIDVQNRLIALKGTSGNMYEDLKKTFFQNLPEIPESATKLLPARLKDLFSKKAKSKV